MADERVRTYGPELTLEANGGSAALNAYVQANDRTVLLTDSPGYPYILFYGSVGYGTAPNANSVIKVYARNLNIISTNDAPAPQDNYEQQYLGNFVLHNVTGTQYVTAPQMIIERPHFDCDIYLKNEGGQTLGAGWQLYAKLWTDEPQA